MKGFTNKNYEELIKSENGRKFIKISKECINVERKNRSVIDQKNDKIYKTLLSIPKERRIYINRTYNRNLKEDEIEIYDKEIIGKRGNLLRADMIFKEKGKNVFYHIEQQTKNDKRMPVRMAGYQVGVMELVGRNKEGKEALVLSSVLHTGEDKWTAAKSIAEIQEDVENGIPKIKGNMKTIGNYELNDIKDYSKEELLESESLVDKAMYLEKMKTEEEFIEGAKEVYKRIEENEKEYMDEVIRIALSGILDVEEIEVLVRELNKGGGKGMLAVKEVLERDLKKRMTDSFLKGEKYGKENGILEGRLEGRLEGKLEGRLESAKNMLKKNMDIDLIEEITGLKREEFM